MTEVGLQDSMLDARLHALQQDGAQQFDAVRFHYLCALAHRAQSHQGGARQLLDAKLEAAAQALRARMQKAQQTATRAATVDVVPGAAANRETLGDLVRLMAQHAPAAPDAVRPQVAGVVPRSELKSVHYFRNTWSKLSAEKQVNQALGQAPKNAGPINSHVVALRSLALMRDTSPDYLNRFMSYVDTLLCLEQGDKAIPIAARAPRAAKTKS